MVALLPLALAGGGLLAGRSLQNRRNRRSQSLVDTILRGEGADAQLAGPPAPLALQEARGTAVVTPLEAAMAAAMQPQQAAQFLAGSAAPRIEERRQLRNAARLQAQQDALVLPENKQLAILRAAQDGSDTYQTISTITRPGTLVELPRAGTDQFLEDEGRLEGAGFALSDANEMRNLAEQMVADPTFGTLDVINTGGGLVGDMRALGARTLLNLRKIYPGTGPIDQQMIDILAGLGIELGRTDVENIGDMLQLLQRNPEATLQGISRLQELLAREAQDALMDTAEYEGIRDETRAQVAGAVEAFSGVTQPLREGRRQSAYDSVLQELRNSDGVPSLQGFADAVIGRATQELNQAPAAPAAPAPADTGANAVVGQAASTVGSAALESVGQVLTGDLTGALTTQLEASLPAQLLQAIAQNLPGWQEDVAEYLRERGRALPGGERSQ